MYAEEHKASLNNASPSAETSGEQAPSPDVEMHETSDGEDSDGLVEKDISGLGKEEIIDLLSKELNYLKQGNTSGSNFRHIDHIIREVKSLYENWSRTESGAARDKYIQDNGDDEGFSFKGDEQTSRIDELSRKLREAKSDYFRNLDKLREKNLATKAALLQRLRALVETEGGKETDAADMKKGWEEFKSIQEEWKNAGNIASAHNGTLWATYHALIDRYFSNRNIYFELKELDRKKNAELKTGLSEKIEELASTLATDPLTREKLNEAVELFEEFKHIGPAPKEDQEPLWQRFKAAMDIVYDAKRAQSEDFKKQSTEIYEAKSKIYESIVSFTAFSSGSINEWNERTKELLVLQDQWIALKGPMPRNEGKQLSKKFWAALKAFFHHKGEFFKQLESKREANLTAKTELCQRAEEILNSGEDSQPNTNRLIELQKEWKSIGQVPEKYKDSIYVRFKTACDAYFDKKRSKSQASEKELEQNLEEKQFLCEKIEALAKSDKESSLEELNKLKDKWNTIGFVPKKNVQTIQKRYIDAINNYVSAIGKLSNKEKELVVLESEAELVKGGASGHDLYRKEGDIRRRIASLENDISVWVNNIEFFAKSKTSDKLKAEFEKKIATAESQVSELKHKLLVLQEAF